MRMHHKTASPIIFYINLHISVNKAWDGVGGLAALQQNVPLSYFTAKTRADAPERQKFISDVLSHQLFYSDFF